ncbi:LysE family transporter [uncultured Roseibium sp.]|uniref:LysE family translocator n=1 Tax=uncultured Roseibium sp. TaxID=1936171 RepID=UPI003217F0AF
MSFLEFALIGFAIGIITTAPVGPVNIMAIQHAAQQGFRQGLYVGLGAVVGDAIYAAAAIFGVSAVTRFVEGQFDLIKAAGAILLIVFGLKIMNTHPHLEREDGGGIKGHWRETTAAFFMVLTNPGVVLAYVAIIGGLGKWRPEPGDHSGALAMVLGVALGAASWWALLSAVVTRFSAKIDDHWLDRANHIAGYILIAFGLVIGADLVFDLFG